jgi:hypothetical protein
VILMAFYIIFVNFAMLNRHREDIDGEIFFEYDLLPNINGVESWLLQTVSFIATLLSDSYVKSICNPTNKRHPLIHRSDAPYIIFICGELCAKNLNICCHLFLGY